jgi:AcrR family transcriptional regulator
MSPRSAPQNDALRAAARSRLVDAALQLFATRGYSGTSVDAIADAAGVSVGLLYYHFADKHSLLRAIFERSLADVGGTFAAADSEKNPADRLPALLRSIGVTIRRDRDFWRVSYGLRMQPEVLQSLGPMVAESTAAIADSLQRYLRATGWPEPAIEARLLFAQIDGMCQHYVLDPEHYPLGRMIERLIKRFSQGVSHDK